MTPQLGDFCVINTGSRASLPIRFGEWLNGDGFSEYDHAVICADITVNGDVYIVEAQPHGAVKVEWHYDQHPHLWSTGRVKTGGRAAAIAAVALVGTPYSWLDYLALAAHRLHIPAPGLQGYIENTKSMICSQLVDFAELAAGVHLFDDGRWPGWVTPAALGDLLRQGDSTIR